MNRNPLALWHRPTRRNRPLEVSTELNAGPPADCGDDLDAAIVEVAYESFYAEALGELADVEAKADALHSTGIVDDISL